MAVSFNGSTSLINYGNVFDIDNTKPLSVEFWALTSAAGNLFIVGKIGNLSHTSQGWTVMHAGGGIYLQINAGASSGANELQCSVAAATVLFNDGNWHHWTITYDGSRNTSGVQFYKDGFNLGAVSTDFNTLAGSSTSSNNFQIGACSGGASPFNGSLWRVRIWNRVLTQQEIVRNMTTKLTGRERGLVFMQNLETPSTTVAISEPTSLILLGVNSARQFKGAPTSVSLVNNPRRMMEYNNPMFFYAWAASAAQALTRALSDSIMRGASRSTTLAGLQTLGRALSDSIMNAASRLATVGKGMIANLTVTMMNAASRLAALSYVFTPVQHYAYTLTVNMMNAASRFTTVAKQWALSLLTKSSNASLSGNAKSSDASLSYFKYTGTNNTNYD